MNQQIKQIETLIDARDTRKAETMIASLLRSVPTPEQYLDLLTLRAQTRLIAARADDALRDLDEIKATAPQRLDQAHMIELLANAHFARFELAKVGFAKKEDLNIARSLYEQIIRRFPRYNNIAWIYYQMGRAMLISANVLGATEAFQTALYSPSKVAVLAAYCYERLAFISYFEHRQAKNALEYLQKAIETYPVESDALWLTQVYLLKSRVLKDSDLKSAIAAAKQALRIASNNTNNKSLVAETAFAVAELLAAYRGSETEIIQYLQKFLQNSKAPLGVDVTWSRVYEMLGDARYATKQYPEAIEAYQQVLKFNPYHPWEESIYYRMARAYYQQEEFDGVIRVLEVLLSEDKSVQDYRIYELLGNALFTKGQYEHAAKAYELALELAPVNINTQSIQKYYALSQRMTSPL